MLTHVRIQCPGCMARIKAPIQLVGQTRACPGCGHMVVVQRFAPEDSGPLLMGFDPFMPPGGRERTDGKLILVADDDMHLNDGLRSVLEKRGYRVIQAADGVQAKELARQQKPDLMILDMMMPRLGGFPVLEEMGAAETPPVIMITAQEGARHKAYAEHLGVFDFIRKPFAMGKLIESIEKGLGLRR